MKITIHDQDYNLSQTDVKLARAAVNEFVNVAKAGATKTQSTALYLTTILMMYKKSLDLINEMGPETVARILKEVNGEE